MTSPRLAAMERIIRTDPARRGLIATEPTFGPLLPGHLAMAAEDLAHHATSVAIVTGFFIPTAVPPAAETDGPLSAVLLAETLRQLEIEVILLTDEFCGNALRVTATQFGFPTNSIHCSHSCGFAQAHHHHSVFSFEELSHLIAIERAGPSHTLTSIEQWQRADLGDRPMFEELIRPEDRDCCFNMRGVCIDQWTAPLHRLFEMAHASGKIRTIGIGDGGNEIGMGSVPWDELVRRLPEPHGAKIICRVPCDYTIVAGVSNWGGYALAAAVADLRGRAEILAPWTCAQQWDCLDRLVREGPAVDGVTRLAEPTVDGLPFATYIQPWDAMRQLLGLSR